MLMNLKTRTHPDILLLDELRLLADALRNVESMFEKDADALDRFCGDQHASVGYRTMADLVEAAMMDQQLETKWDVESEDLLLKLHRLSEATRRKIVLGVVEFWERSSDRRAEEVLHAVLDEINAKNAKQEPDSTSVSPKPLEV
jgi:hypothetical protein